MKSLCGIDCSLCKLGATCKGCVQSNGFPFGEECLVGAYCKKGESALFAFKQKLIDAFRELGIEELEELTELNALKGSFINLEFFLPSGETVKFWNDNRIYLGNQLQKKDSDLCYGIAADDKYLMVCEYGQNSTHGEVVVFKRWN